MALAILGLAAGCANVPLQQGGSLSSYEGLSDASAMTTKAKLRVETPAVLSARTVQIVPTSVSPAAAEMIGKTEDRVLVANAIDRALCVGLSERYQVVEAGQPSDLVVRARIANMVPTGRAAAGLSTALSLGASAVLPVPVPRLPIGLGGLAVEAEAVSSRDGVQRAAILWAKGANSITTKGRVSQVGDAYTMAAAFGSDFSRILVKGEAKIGGVPQLPSMQAVRSALGGTPKYAACEAFGRAPGIGGMVAGQLGLPPSMADNGLASR